METPVWLLLRSKLIHCLHTTQFWLVKLTKTKPLIFVVHRKYRDQKYMKHVNDKYRVKLGVKGNKFTQNYFRNQVMF